MSGVLSTVRTSIKHYLYILKRLSHYIYILIIIFALSTIAIWFQNVWAGILTGSIGTLVITFYVLRFTDVLTSVGLRLSEKWKETSEKQQKEYIKHSVESAIDIYEDDYFSHHLARELVTVDVQWVSHVSDMNNDETVIILSQNNSYKQNICTLIYEYIRRSAVPNGRRLIDNSILGGIDYYLTKDILENVYENNSVSDIINWGNDNDPRDFTQISVDEIFEKNIDDKCISISTLNERRLEIEAMREEGYFSTILIGELSKVSGYFESTDDVSSEITDFYVWTYQRSQERGELKREFSGDLIDIGIVKIDRSERIDKQYERTVRCMNYHNTAYILAIGKSAVLAKDIYDSIVGAGDQPPQEVNRPRTDEFSLSNKRRWYAQIEMKR
jgi:predicted DNA-binding protein